MVHNHVRILSPFTAYFSYSFPSFSPMSSTTSQSINPFTNEFIGIYPFQDLAEAKEQVKSANRAAKNFRSVTLEQRAGILIHLAGILRTRIDELALLMSTEMGKPVTQCKAEIEKCAWLCEYYAEFGPQALKDQIILTDASRSFVRYSPLGTLLAIMPWNYPFWQFFRVAVPNLLVGNAVLLKHAPNVQGCAHALVEIFQSPDLPIGMIANLHLSNADVAQLIAQSDVHGVTLTGSTMAGSTVASIAGKHLKKTVLELGGSNPFIILEDADLDRILPIAFQARMQNTGQSCIAAKRFLVHESLHRTFTERMEAVIHENPIINPQSDASTMGVLARTDLAENLKAQLNASIRQGAKLVTGGEQKGAHFSPALLTDVTPEMTCFREETFGPLACVTSFSTKEEAIALANTSDYGLGATVCTADVASHLDFCDRLDEGAVFFNDMVKSHPALPFGGIKKSGYGRELALEGLRAFANCKSIYFK